MASEIPPQHGSRLAVFHLLIWMLGCGIALVGYQELTPELQAGFRWFGVVYNLGMAMAFGAALGSLAVVAQGWFRRDPWFPSLPGHSLLLFALVAAMVNASVIGVLRSRWFSVVSPPHIRAVLMV